MSTDIEGAMQLALSTFPVQGARRILLISDGNENRGHALTAALRAREQGIAVFTVPAGGTAPLPVKVQSIASRKMCSPENGSRCRCKWIARARFRARLDYFAGPGDRIGEGGLTCRQQCGGCGGAHRRERREFNGGAYLQRRSRAGIVLASRDRAPAPCALRCGRQRVFPPLLKTLKLAQVDVETATGFPVTPGAGDWDAVLLDNYPDHILSPEEDAALEKYVYAGGGLIFIAGNRNAKLAQEPESATHANMFLRGALRFLSELRISIARR